MRRPRGRPPRADGPAFDTEEVERIYRDGVLVEREDGSIERTFPGPREIAEQLGVSASTISRFAKKRGLAELRRARMAEFGDELRSSASTAHRQPGRPRRGAEPQVDWPQVERDYIEGVAYRRADGTPAVMFPDQVDLAERYGVSEATMSRFLSQRDARQRRKAVLESLPARVEVPSSTPSPERTMTLLGSANANLIEGGRLLSQQWVDSVRAGDVRSNDPVVVEKGVRMALDAEAREAGIGTAGATIQIPVEYLERARRALERRQVPLDPMMTGIVIDAASAQVESVPEGAPGDT